MTKECRLRSINMVSAPNKNKGSNKRNNGDEEAWRITEGNTTRRMRELEFEGTVGEVLRRRIIM